MLSGSGSDDSRSCRASSIHNRLLLSEISRLIGGDLSFNSVYLVYNLLVLLKQLRKLFLP